VFWGKSHRGGGRVCRQSVSHAMCPAVGGALPVRQARRRCSIAAAMRRRCSPSCVEDSSVPLQNRHILSRSAKRLAVAMRLCVMCLKWRYVWWQSEVVYWPTTHPCVCVCFVRGSLARLLCVCGSACPVPFRVEHEVLSLSHREIVSVPSSLSTTLEGGWGSVQAFLYVSASPLGGLWC